MNQDNIKEAVKLVNKIRMESKYASEILLAAILVELEDINKSLSNNNVQE